MEVTPEDLLRRKEEKQAQLKILESLDFESVAANREEVEEQFSGKPQKKFKTEKGDIRLTDAKKSDSKNQYERKQSFKNKKHEPKQMGEEETKSETADKNAIRNMKVKPIKEVSSNWQKFLSSQQQSEGQQAKGEGNHKKSYGNQSKEEGNKTKITSQPKLEPSNEGFKGQTPIVAMDCEMVQCQGKQADMPPTQELARVSIVNYNGHVLLDSFVRPQKKIKDYLTRVSGITFNLIKNAPTYPEIKDKMFDILKDRIIVGHSIQNDLSAVKFEPSSQQNLRDISNFKALRKAGKKVSLKNLVHQQLGITFQEGSHDSVADARAALLIYKKFQKEIDAEQGKK